MMRTEAGLVPTLWQIVSISFTQACSEEEEVNFLCISVFFLWKLVELQWSLSYLVLGVALNVSGHTPTHYS